MTTKAMIDDFLAQRTLAIVGVSRKTEKFGCTVYKELKAKGYRVFPVNSHAEEVMGDRCYPRLSALPEPVGGVVIVVPPAETERVVQDAAAAKIPRVWMQQGAESEAALRFCQDNGMSVVSGECILMFAGPVGFGHGLHRWVWGLLGKLPK